MPKTKIYFLITVGHLVINLPAVLISFGLPILAFTVFDVLAYRLLFGVLGFLIGIGLSWGVWSFLITKWRVWAFGQIEEEYWYELYEIAVANRLIWDNGNVFERTEYRSHKDSALLSPIQESLAVQEEIEIIKLDLATSKELGFKLNKKTLWIELAVKIFLLAVSISLLFTDKYILSIVLSVFIFYGKSYVFYPYIFSNKEVLVINDKGIERIYKKEGLISWQTIQSLEIDRESWKLIIEAMVSGKSTKLKLDLGYFKIDNIRKFERQLDVYIERFLNKYAYFDSLYSKN